MESNEASICPLCRNEKVKIFAVGECSHPVCYLCSTKMRILCEQTYCAICRQDLPRVYFVSNLADNQPTVDQSRFTPIDETGDCGIYYPTKSEWIRRETETLLRNYCPFCYVEYETFEILRDHVRRAHRYFYCDLCVEHLNLFPFERKCYTRHDLVQHIRSGDPDDKSFKGHPLCKFCDDHFIDVDQLYQHMRKEHYYCHLCTTDNVYYSGFDLLRDHYRSNHYLCEIGQCKDVQFTNVFSSDFEFRAHQAAQHSKSRAEARQLGNLAVAFQSISTRDRRPQHDSVDRGTSKSGESNTQGNSNSSKNERDDAQQETAAAAAVSVPTIDEFPTLNERSSTPQNVPQQRGAWSNDSARGINSTTEFPALTGASSNVSATNIGQPRGIWREQQQQQPTASLSSITQNATSKKAAQPAKPVTNGTSSMNIKEDYPALKAASNTKIPAPVSMFSAWSTAKKSAKNATANAKGNQSQIRMNTSRLVNDEEDEEYIRRPMSSLTTSTTPMASSNITMVSSSDVSNASVNGQQKKNKNQSLPNAQDFPALPSTTTTQNNNASSGIWTAGATNSSVQSPTTQQKKKTAAMSKKKFMEEVQGMPPPPSLASTDDFPTFGLSELGRRLITDENEPTVTAQVKKEKPLPTPPPPSSASSTAMKQGKKDENESTVTRQVKKEKPLPTPTPPSSSSSSTSVKQGKKDVNESTVTTQVKKEKPLSAPPSSSTAIKQEEKEEKKPTVQSNTKAQKATKTNEPIKQETPPTKDKTSEQQVTNQTSSQSVVKDEPAPKAVSPPTSSTQPPPGFTAPLPVPPPPGFNPIPSSQPAPPSYIFSSSYPKQKDEFRAKLFNLFDGDMNLFVEYDTFCEAFSQNKIPSKDFIKFTTQLFKDKLDEYLLELITIIPHIEQQNELYSIWQKDIHPTATQNTNNWTKKNLDEKTIHTCRICRQIMFETDTDEHNSYHTEFNTQFPSLPTAAFPIGRSSGKKNK